VNSYPDRRRFGPGARSDAEALRLLVVDDDSNYCAYIRIIAQKIGFAVDVAADGESALEQLTRHAYDVAVIDQEMPRLNGLGLIGRMRADETTRGVYALMLTGREDLETKLTALDRGFDDFMTKSSSEAELVAKLAASKRIAARQRTLDSTARELYGMATRDELTTVFNRRFFVAETARVLAEGTSLSLVLFDLDRFKEVNDTFGHLAGDQVLHDVGVLFQRSTRAEDLIARFGGDEFVMVIAVPPIVDVEAIAARLVEEVQALQWVVGEERFGISVTTGFASTDLLSQPTVDRLLDVADRDLYKNKWARKNPEARPDLYEYPAAGRKIDLVLPLRPTPVEPDPEVPSAIELPPQRHAGRPPSRRK
jgi:diguanylate cyclase (GGDEF)-like protein